LAENIKLEEMTSPEIRAAIDSGIDTVVFAVGSNEQHGPCLPVSTDTAIGDRLAHFVAEKLGDALKGPTINIGCSEHHMEFPGTISLRKETLQNVIKDYCESLARHGFRHIVIIPSHGGNFGPLAEIEEELRKAHPNVDIIAYTDLQQFIDILHKTSAKLGVSKEESGAHAGESEVSMMLWTRGDLVKIDKIPEATGYLREFTEKEAAKVFEGGIGALSPIGVLGSPVKASREHGRIYLEELASAMIEFISRARS
jgi:creatinine amidohydrolase